MLDDVDQVLAKASSVLDREHQAVRDAAEEVGLPRPSSEGDRSAGLFGTTQNNISRPSEAREAPEQGAELTADDHTRYLGSATRRIARGMDADETVLGLCRASVPTFSDAILVYLRDPIPVGDERPVAPWTLVLRRTDSVPKEHVSDIARLDDGPGDAIDPLSLVGSANPLLDVSRSGPLAHVLRGVRSVLCATNRSRAALRELTGWAEAPGGRQAILAPLRGRRRVIGVAVFLRAQGRTPFEEEDLQVAQQLATHSALGVDKALHYGRDTSLADELQRSMLPDHLPQPTGVQLASRYLSAAQSDRVGGDWYDAIPLPGGRVALVVGDVMGHSTTSAAIMGQLRTTVHTLAGLDLPPQEVLHHLDEQVQRLSTDRMATCLYAVYDPVMHRITMANAGHPPPVLLRPDGSTERIDLPTNVPIGVGGGDFRKADIEAMVGATLVLYTDGLVESRTRDVWRGVNQLQEKLTAVARTSQLKGPPPLEPLCDEILNILPPGDRDDDVALLAARFEGIAPDRVALCELEPTAESVRKARRFARACLERWKLTAHQHTLELLVSEVVTNAARYAERPVSVRLLYTNVLRCEVGDDVPLLPRLRQAMPSDRAGRGLYVVDRLTAGRWGATRLSTGKLVWFELPLPPSATEPSTPPVNPS
ncbi:ATP-binding SpoIIE family protein phosphatase [Streptomyces sp. 4N509B]|uniref:ATP-binding SpoIIE family protein phosphatase n=1 Tax=Streptomyces sp. 4N509B TaxID=3457413 RepID=UPI003FD389B7